MLIDYQNEMFEAMRSETRPAKPFNTPIVLSTAGVEYKINGQRSGNLPH